VVSQYKCTAINIDALHTIPTHDICSRRNQVRTPDRVASVIASKSLILFFIITVQYQEVNGQLQTQHETRINIRRVVIEFGSFTHGLKTAN
jgi:hypothetical protein